MVYFIKSDNLVKIGYTKDVKKRLAQLQTSNGNKLEILYVIEGDKNTEYMLHNYFEDFRSKSNNEWFYYNDSMRRWISQDKINQHHIKL